MKNLYFFMLLFAVVQIKAQTLNESFEGDSFPPEGWEHYLDTDNTKGWSILSYSSHSASSSNTGDKFAEFESYYTSKGLKAELVTPALDLTAGSFALRFFTVITPGSDGLHIDVSNDDGTSWQEDKMVISNSPGETRWTEHNLDLSDFSSYSKVKIRFRASSTYGSGKCNIALDDVQLYHPTPMQVQSTVCSQPNTDLASIGSAKNEILQLKITTSGMLNPVKATQFTLSTQGTTNVSDITRAALYFSSNPSGFATSTLFGEAVKPNGEFSISGSQSLTEGDNYFWLAYDISESAKNDNSLDAEYLNVTVDGSEYTPSESKPEGSRLLRKMLNMQSGTSSNTVDGTLAFYDDGGVNGNYSENFEGTVTFVPKSPDKKIKITWNNFAIFNTSSTGKNDIFKIYNGTGSTDEKNLIGQYSSTPPAITSMSDDGALTIYFKVNTGVPKSGWDATIKEIVPQDMAFVSAKMTQPVSDDIAAADENQIIALFELNTQYTENRLQVQSFDLSTDGTTNTTNIANAKIYYTANTSDFNANNLFGKISAPSGSYTISGSQRLTEGKNHFWLVYDISTTAQNGNILDAELTSVNISGTSQSPDNSGDPGSRTINNTYFMPGSGSHSKTIYIPVTFVDDGGLNDKYSPFTSSTVTFLPGKEGERIKMNFEAFDIYYSSTSYGTKSIFKIYNGSGTGENDLLWEANENNFNTGPVGIINSTATDGALTLKFNAKASSSVYTKAGWNASIWSEEPKDMEFETAETDQPGDIVKAGSTNQQILHVKVNFSGALNPVSNVKFTFNTSGSSNDTDIKAARLYSTGRNSVFSANNQSGESIDTPSGQFTISHSGEMHEGVNHFWLVYDISSDATVDNVVDASLDKITVTTNEYSIDNGNPDGSRTIKRLYELETGSHNVIVGEKPLAFYDNGGVTYNYSKDFEGTVTFIPDNENQRIRLDIDLLEVTWAEKIKIYNGSAVDDNNLLIELDNDNNINSTDSPISVKSTSDDGKLTVYFKAPSYSSPKTGWEASVYSFTPQPYYYKDASVYQGVSSAIRGETNILLLKIPTVFAGETTSATVNAISFNTNGCSDVTDIKSAQIYYTGTDKEFNPISAVPYGSIQTSPSGSVTINGNQEIATEDSVYFWLMYNVNSNASAGNVLDAELISIRVNDEDHNFAEGNPAGVATIKTGLAGNFTIGADSEDDYASFSNAFIDLTQKGIESSVTFTVDGGLYNERPALGDIKGASASNTITFISVGSNPDIVVLTSEEAPSTSYDAPDDAVLRVNGADFITFSNITIKTSQKQYDALVLVTNQSRHVTFDRCVFDAPVEPVSSNIDIAGIKNKAENVANHNNDYLTIKNSRFIGGYIGAYIGGTGYVKLPKEKGAQIINNTFEKQTSKGIYINDEATAIVKSNKVINNSTSKNGFQGIDAYRNINGTIIANNTIQIDLPQYAIGIQCRPLSGTENNPAKLYNNSIALTQTPDNSYGILLDDGCSYVDCFHNTIALQGGEANSSSALFVDGKASEVPHELMIKNNLFINNKGGLAIKVKYETFLNGIEFDYNNLHSSGTNLGQCGFSSSLTEFPNLAAWQQKVTAIHSISEDVEFYSSTDLHIKTSGNLKNALPVSYISTDIDGQQRDQSTPTIGAYEYKTPDSTAPRWNDGYPTINNQTYNSGSVQLSADKSGQAWWIVLPVGSAIPDHAQVKEGNDADDNAVDDHLKGNISLAKDQVSEFDIKLLNSNTEYIVCIALEDNLGVTGSTVSSLSFTTDFRPTETSTFENINSDGQAPFEDGTASFTNVSTANGDGVEGSAKFGVIDAGHTATIALTNTNKGLTIEGFFFKSAGNFTFKVTKADHTYSSDISINPSEFWQYADLKSFGDIIGIEIQAFASPVSIDNFSGKPLELRIISFNAQPVYRGESTPLKAEVCGGVMPYSYTWTSASTTKEYSVAEPVIAPESTCEYQLVVSDARGASTRGTVIVNVSGSYALPATFEKLLIEDETHWAGNPDKSSSYFYSGSFKFNNYYFPNYSTWGNFGYSNETSTSFNSDDYFSQQFHSAVGHGANNSKTYGVVYAFGSNPEVVLTNTSEGEELTGCYITNTAWTVSSMENGDSFSGDPFKKGDWFKVIIEGYNNDNTLTGSIDCYMADYRSENAEEHYILKEWKWIDLSSLGTVQKLRFKVEGSRNNASGLTTPGYFCIDNINGTRDDTPTAIPGNNYDTIVMYPNPTHGKVNINLSSLNNAERIEIVDFSGKIVLSKEATPKKINQVDLSTLKRGFYILRIVAKKNIITGKIYKQ